MTLDHRMASLFRQSDYYCSFLEGNERRETKTELYCSIGVVLYTERRPECGTADSMSGWRVKNEES